MKKTFLLFAFIGFTATLCHATIWRVGATRTYTLPSAVANLVLDGWAAQIRFFL